jgi:uncharacterized membrane protein YfcA
MVIVLISLVALLASALTFFSGFGLGTILSPFMFIFFPVEIAIALTGIVHFLNNVFKIFLVWRQIDWPIVLKFGTAALVTSFAGAMVLLNLSQNSTVLYAYYIGDSVFKITWIKLLIAVLMLSFVVLEAHPRLKNYQFKRQSLIPGGLISGFFGGLSGNQGALRSMFLLKSGLSKEAYISSGIAIACLVDISRLGVYAGYMKSETLSNNNILLTAAVLSAFTGAYLGSKILKKVTIKLVNQIVTVMLLILSVCLGCGLI